MRNWIRKIKNFFYWGYCLRDDYPTDCCGFLEGVVYHKCKLFIKGSKKNEQFLLHGDKYLKKVKIMEEISKRLFYGGEYEDTVYSKRIEELRKEWKKYSISFLGSYNLDKDHIINGKIVASSWLHLASNCPTFQEMIGESKEFSRLTGLEYKIWDDRRKFYREYFDKLLIKFGDNEW